MKRIATTFPGYDCERGPCPNERHPDKPCPGFGRANRPGGGHGIHGDEWKYAVVSDCGRGALRLTVYTGIYPATVPAWIDRNPARGADLTFHVSVPTSDDDARCVPGAECDLLPGGRCFSTDTTGLGADEFFAKHGAQSFEQPEAFWKRLEAFCAAKIDRDLTLAAKLEHGRCPTCKGTGLVKV